MTPRGELTPSAARVLVYVEQCLKDGFTGTLTLECDGGGVREVGQYQRLDGRDFGNGERTVRA
jgi:hypothetical protein